MALEHKQNRLVQVAVDVIGACWIPTQKPYTASMVVDFAEEMAKDLPLPQVCSETAAVSL